MSWVCVRRLGSKSAVRSWPNERPESMSKVRKGMVKGPCRDARQRWGCAAIDIVLQCIERIRCVVFGMRSDRAIRPQQCRSLAVEIVIGDHVECDTLHREPIDQMGVGGKMPHAGTAGIEERDVSGPHRQQWPAQARIADAATVRMPVVGRRAIFGMLVGIPRIGMPLGLPRAKGVVDATALVIAIDLIGEGRGQKDDRRRRGARPRQHINRHDVRDVITAQADAVNPRRNSVGDVESEVGFPAAIVEIVLGLGLSFFLWIKFSRLMITAVCLFGGFWILIFLINYPSTLSNVVLWLAQPLLIAMGHGSLILFSVVPFATYRAARFHRFNSLISKRSLRR
jgi:hypothetical protein